MTPLASLLAAVEGGDKWSDAQFVVFGCGTDALNNYQRAFSGSTDAAISLCKAMLPGWVVTLMRLVEPWDGVRIRSKASDWRAVLSDGGLVSDERQTEATDPNPARALLIATLRALVAMERTP